MTSLLFVCLGNICRSPAAESITKKIIIDDKLDFFCDSAGVLDYHKGELADPRMREALSARGYDMPSRSRPFESKDFLFFDRIIVMDNQNYRDIKKKDIDNNYSSKILKMAHYSKSVDEIPDPYYGSKRDFEQVIDLLEDACYNMLSDFNHLK